MTFVFSPHSVRARKSRLYVRISKEVWSLLAAVAVLLAASGVALWVSSYGLIGAILLASASALLLPVLWYKYDIHMLTPNLVQARSGDTIDITYALPVEVVGNLGSIDSTQDMWQAIKHTWFAYDFCSRFNIPSSAFEDMSLDANVTAQHVLENALRKSEENQLNLIAPSALIIAILEVLPSFETVLAQAKLQHNDLLQAIRWQQHEYGVLHRSRRRDQAGGLARDWTSGFTPTLDRMGRDLSLESQSGSLRYVSVQTHQKIITEMLQNLLKPRANVVLIGEVGSGKTISVYGLAKQLITDPHTPESLRYYKIYEVSASALIASSPDPELVEQTLYGVVAEAAKAKDIALFFENASSLFTSGNGAADLRRALLEIVQAGPLPIVLEMTPTEWQTISAENPELAGMLNVLHMPETEPTAILDVLEDHCLLLEAQHKVHVTFAALQECINLSDRYINTVAQPGRSIQLLESAVTHTQNGRVLASSVQEAVESTFGVKVSVASATEGKELLDLEEKIHARMVNQSRAVKVVSDALRRARSGVADASRPIGTFLFLGPTGVGKTELSKAISAVYFGDESKLIRLDMNEFTQSSDVARLLDVQSPTSLLSMVGRNRFAAVLFDEIEKAHPDVVNAILQLLDEGVMRDAQNRPVSFRDTIIIATSNAGADRIRAYIYNGQEVQQFERPFINELIDNRVFLPEFINRFDEVVVFRPLKDDELMQVADLLLAEVNQTLAHQRISVALSTEAKQWLVEHGNDPRLGARPLRRVVQQTVENIIAKKVLSGQATAGSLVQLGVPDLEAEQSTQ